MIILDAAQTAEALPWLPLVDALREGFIKGCETPLRHVHEFEIPQETTGSLLLMPAWATGEYLGLKQVMVIPENHLRSLSSVAASYQLSNAVSGELLAVIDGNVLTHRRTAAASALASQYLSRESASQLLVVGTGGLARSLIQAHVAARPITEVKIWGRNPDKSQMLADEMQAIGITATPVDDLQAATARADIISCATMAETPLVLGKDLAAGTHIDLVGGFKPSMREADDETIQRGSVFVDTREGALSEAGDLTQPIENGVFKAEEIQADLFELARGQHTGRQDPQEITVFKSVGAALEDLFAAALAYENSIP